MYAYHEDKSRYFEMQYLTARDFIIPFLESVRPLKPQDRILEIGCAEAGVLKAFLEKDLFCYGIDLSPARIETAKKFHTHYVERNQVKFISKNIYDIDVIQDLEGPFDIIVLKDVIEHIPHQEKFIPVLKNYLKPGGLIFMGFPPWQMPFGGHQQMCTSKLLSKLPWFHLLPRFAYKQLLKWGGQDEITLNEFMEIKDTGISIERFECIVETSGFKIAKRRLYLTNPIYKYKFNLEPKIIFKVFANIPFFRNFYTTAAYYAINN